MQGCVKQNTLKDLLFVLSLAAHVTHMRQEMCSGFLQYSGQIDNAL